MNTCPITISTLLPNDNTPHTYQSILRDNFINNFDVLMISNEIAQFKLIFSTSSNVSLNLGTYKNIIDPKPS